MFGEVKGPERRRGALIDADAARRDSVALMLGTRDFELVGRYGSVGQALGAGTLPDLTLVHVDMADRAACADIARLRAEADTAILALIDRVEPAQIEALHDAGADHVLPVGLQPDRFAVGAAGALGAARRRRAADRAVAKAEAALASAKTLYRAKVILIARQGLSEDEAHRRLQEMSMTRNLPLAEMAKRIVEAESLLC